jgi:hypothetical protein
MKSEQAVLPNPFGGGGGGIRIRIIIRRSFDSPPSRAEVKNAWSYTSTHPYVFITWYLLKTMDDVIQSQTRRHRLVRNDNTVGKMYSFSLSLLSSYTLLSFVPLSCFIYITNIPFFSIVLIYIKTARIL